MGNLINLSAVANAILFSLLGVVFLVIAFFIIEKIMPQDLYKEVVLNRNNAVAIVAAAFILAIAIIISGAIRG